MRRFVSIFLLIVVFLAFATWFFFGATGRLEDRTTDPAFPASVLEVVADLDYPPGNVAVAADGRVFFTLHPEGAPPIQLAELIRGKPVSYPSEAFQKAADGTPHFQSVLAIRIDRQNRLWALDYGRMGFGQPRIVAFDLPSREVVHSHDFPSEVAGFLSMLNDFQVDPEGRRIYIAESSPLLSTPAIVVYDTETKSSRRLLEGHASVEAEDYVIRASGRAMVIAGVFAMKIGIDSIALDKRGEWLYYGPLSGDQMYRVKTADLNDASLSPQALAGKVENYAIKTLSDGLSMDLDDNVYVTGMEQSAILAITPKRGLRTLVKDERIRWPDGLSFGPDGWLYVTCSALQHVIARSGSHMRSQAPFQIFRFKPGPQGVPGH